MRKASRNTYSQNRKQQHLCAVNLAVLDQRILIKMSTRQPRSHVLIRGQGASVTEKCKIMEDTRFTLKEESSLPTSGSMYTAQDIAPSATHTSSHSRAGSCRDRTTQNYGGCALLTERAKPITSVRINVHCSEFGPPAMFASSSFGSFTFAFRRDILFSCERCRASSQSTRRSTMPVFAMICSRKRCGSYVKRTGNEM